jgi:hypothetical protein
MSNYYSYSKYNSSVLGEPTNIISLDKYNGRVNIIEPEDPTVVFKMQERIALKNKATDYSEAIVGQWEPNTLATVFFCAENVQILQNAIRAGVYKMSGDRFVIGVPNVDTLKIIMRSTYIQYAEHYPDRITEQVQKLNDIVLDYAVQSTYSEAVGYQKYCEDISSLAMPMDKPLAHDRNYKQLELKPWF